MTMLSRPTTTKQPPIKQGNHTTHTLISGGMTSSITSESSCNGKRLTIIAVCCLILLDVAYYHHVQQERKWSSSIQAGGLAADAHGGHYQKDVVLAVQEPFPRRQLTEKGVPNPHVEFDSNDPHLSLFQYSEYTVLGPSQFATPTHLIQTDLQTNLSDDEKKKKTIVEVEPLLKPTLGEHRADQDAVFLFASEYDLSIYQGFILSLRKTGYRGDIVLAVSPLDMAAPGVTPTPRQKQLSEFFASDPHVIIYVVPFVCFNAEGEAVDSAKGGMRVCQCNVLYGSRKVTKATKKGEKDVVTEWQPLKDWRTARPVATTRYELYWIWATHYHKHSWIMLIDARDTYFQTDPFAEVPREPNPDRNDGVLFFFGENSDATRIGKSDKNRKWMTTAYGDSVIQAMEQKPTICSGATMGEQIALETYLRSMVNEFDETEVKLMGADQGFHNYLYYSAKLQNAKKIRSISVFDQGRGIVNNMGAMRTKELSEWGNGNMVKEQDGEFTILNWDGKPSPVMHQFDRFKSLSAYVYKKKTKELQDEWKKQQSAATSKRL